MFAHALAQDNALRAAKRSAYKEYLKLSQNELFDVIRDQMSRPGRTLELNIDAQDQAVKDALKNSPVALKALSTTGGTALIRQDLEVPLS